MLTQAFAGVGQVKNVMLDDVGEGPACQLTIAINPRQPANILAARTPDNLYVTKDGGTTWAKKKVSSPLGVSGDPALITDEKGNFYFFHQSASDGSGEEGAPRPDRIVVQRSGDGGENWSDGESIGVNPSRHLQGQWATIDGRGNLYVSWTQFDRFGDPSASCQSNIMFSMSKNGKKWTEPVVISQAAGSCVPDGNGPSGAVPAVTYDGKVMIAWSGHESILLDRSFNGGEWWLSNDIVVNAHTGGSVLDIPGHGACGNTPMLLTDNSKSHYRGSLYLVWADQRNGEDDTDIWFTRSHNFGDNWSAPSRVNDDGKGKHQYMPWMAVDQSTGYIYILYYDRRNYDDNRTDVYLAYSTDGGASFRNVRISEEPFTPSEGAKQDRYNSVSAQKGIIAPIWTRVDDGKVTVWTAAIRHEDLAPKK